MKTAKYTRDVKKVGPQPAGYVGGKRAVHGEVKAGSDAQGFGMQHCL